MFSTLKKWMKNDHSITDKSNQGINNRAASIADLVTPEMKAEVIYSIMYVLYILTIIICLL